MSAILVDPQTETVFEWTVDPATKGLVKITLKNSYGRKCKCCGCNCPCRCNCCTKICCSNLSKCP